MADTILQPIQVPNGTNNALITGSGRRLRSALLNPAAAASTMTIYDALTATGTPIMKIVAGANLGTTISPDVDIELHTGLTVVIAGAAADGFVYVI